MLLVFMLSLDILLDIHFLFSLEFEVLWFIALLALLLYFLQVRPFNILPKGHRLASLSKIGTFSSITHSQAIILYIL